MSIYLNNKRITPILGTILPDQTDHSGEFLTTDGTDTSWAEVQALPSQTGHSGDLLTTDGTNASWGATGQIYPVIETYSNGASWYRIYAPDSTGYQWCEQGGIISIPNTNTVTTITLLKPFASTNYNVVSSANPSSVTWATMVNCQITAKTTSSFGITNNVANNENWQACGYIEPEKHYAE